MRTRSMRVFALLLSLLFLLTFAGCAAQTTQPEQEAAQAADEPQTAVPEADPAAIQQFSVNKENSVLIPATDYSLYPLDDGSNTLTLWYGGWSNDYVDEINELWNFKEAERVTGVHVEYTICAQSTESETKNLMYASGLYDDMITFMMNDYSGGYAAAIEDEVYIDVKDYIAQYCPNYTAILDSSEEIRRSVTSDEGLMTGFYQINTSIQPSFQGLYVRGDWLKKVGMEAPTTFDQLHDVMVAFRDQCGTSFGISLSDDGTNVALSYGLDFFPSRNGWYVIDGQVQNAFVSDGYRTYLEYISQWYKEGLVYTDFVSGTEMDLYLTDEAGAFCGMAEEIYNLPPQADDPNSELTPCVYPTLTGTEEVHLGGIGEWVGNAGIAVTTACENIELVCKWLDFFYSDYGYMINNYGQEGVTYIINDAGEIEYTELLTNDPDGRTMMTVRAIYTGLGAAGKAWLYDWSASQIGAPDTLELTHIAWETDGAYLIPQMTTLTTEESNLVTSIVGDCSTYWEEMNLKFIVGETPLNDETWQDYVDHIYGLGIQSAIDAQQAALARYYNRG